MKHWTSYQGHFYETEGKRKLSDGTIYTFDIETSSYYVLAGKVYPACEYLSLTEDEKEEAEYQSNMYIWQMGINDQVYYGRTWQELKIFWARIDKATKGLQKYVYVHNLAYEFQYMRFYFEIDKLFARKTRKPLFFNIPEFNMTFRCSLMLTNMKLEKLPEEYGLKTKKLVGDLDYSLIRHSYTELTPEEMSYCENDCLIIYELIEQERKRYGTIKKIPLTSTGHVRRELQELVDKDYYYINKVRRSINTDPIVFNYLTDAFAGGYTHSNWIYTSEILKFVTSYDFTSSYPYVMLSEKYPMTKFKPCFVKKKEEFLENFAYLLHVSFYNLESRTYNSYIQASKCKLIKGATYNDGYDNGRIRRASEVEMIITELDFDIIMKMYQDQDTHKDVSYTIHDAFISKKGYLPLKLHKFILDKYKLKTQYKGVPEKQYTYNQEKAKFNAIYGMSVTNNIRDEVIYTNDWDDERELTNDEIIEKLLKEEQKGFMSYAWGVWVTAYARYNLLTNVINLDDFVVYCDTDSIKLVQGFDKNVIKNYNKNVKLKLMRAGKHMGIDFEEYQPVDKFGNKHLIGVFDFDGFYHEFITQGAKKYAVREHIKTKEKIPEHKLVTKITVAGVPKTGAKELKHLSDFKDGFVFTHETTNKNVLMYNDSQKPVNLIDYQGNTTIVKDKSGCCIVPTTYVLGRTEQYIRLIESSNRAVYKIGGEKNVREKTDTL